jgi:hypothetical protein
MDINISHTRSTLYTLNQMINQKCGKDMTIEFDHYDTMILKRSNVALYDNGNNTDFHLLLCLNYKSNCIASISCKINNVDGSMEISSKTESVYEGRKYNLLLRCAIVLLSSSIMISRTQKVSSIVSRAINPISILLMAKYFRATNSELETFVSQNNLSYETLTLDDMQSFYDELNTVPDFDTEEEEMNYLENMKSFGNPVLLTINIHDPSIINNTRQLLSQLAIKCPNASAKASSMPMLGGKTKNNKKKNIKRNKMKTKKKRNKKQYKKEK